MTKDLVDGEIIVRDGGRGCNYLSLDEFSKFLIRRIITREGEVAALSSLGGQIGIRAKVNLGIDLRYVIDHYEGQKAAYKQMALEEAVASVGYIEYPDQDRGTYVRN